MGIVVVLAITAKFGIAPLRERLQPLRQHLIAYPIYDPWQFDLRMLAGAVFDQPTTLTFGRDGRLYVGEIDGMITALEVRREGDDFEVVASEEIPLVHEMPNHDDLGRPAPEIVGRLLTSIVPAGTASDPVFYVSSSDPRFLNAGIDTNSGVVSRLQRHDGRWVRTDLVRGLPRSRVDHAPHGIALDEQRNVLFLAQGANTNAGARSDHFLRLSEYALAGTIVEIDLAAIDRPPYDLPTLDDEDRPGSPDANDPFGGNDGKNQAVITRDGPVQIYATGIRNVYDLALTRHGLYAVDNGANQLFGGKPRLAQGTRRVENSVIDGGRWIRDRLHRVTKGEYYGHPNPVRANADIRFNATNPQSSILEEQPREARRRSPRHPGRRMTAFRRSTNGIVEYHADPAYSADRIVLLAVGQDQAIHRLRLDETGMRVIEHTTLARNLGFFPLDIVTRSVDEVYPTTIWLCGYTGGYIWVLDPQRSRSSSVTQLARDLTESVRMHLQGLASY